MNSRIITVESLKNLKIDCFFNFLKFEIEEIEKEQLELIESFCNLNKIEFGFFNFSKMKEKLISKIESWISDFELKSHFDNLFFEKKYKIVKSNNEYFYFCNENIIIFDFNQEIEIEFQSPKAFYDFRDVKEDDHADDSNRFYISIYDLFVKQKIEKKYDIANIFDYDYDYEFSNVYFLEKNIELVENDTYFFEIEEKKFTNLNVFEKLKDELNHFEINNIDFDFNLKKLMK